MLLRLSAAIVLSIPAFSSTVATGLGPSDGVVATPATATTGVGVVTTVPNDDSSPATTENPFLPERENVSECFGGVPRPNCGSKARGGWRQGLVFGAVAAAIVVIGVRVAIGVRKRATPTG